jgi:hypothetical protein
VEQLKAACRECSEKKDTITLYSLDTTAPMAGMPWRVMAECDWIVDSSGVKVGLFAQPTGYPSSDADVLCMQGFTLTCQGICKTEESKPMDLSYAWGNHDFFGIGVMSGGGAVGGWDEAAWAAKGLPTEGELEVQLTMQEVS